MILLLSFAGFSATGLLLLVHAACFAPEGEEDTKGFRFAVSRASKTTAADRHATEHGGLTVVSR